MFAAKMDNSPEDDFSNANRLDPNEPNKPGDIVVYGNDNDGNGILEGNEIDHSAKVTQTDKYGNTM